MPSLMEAAHKTIMGKAFVELRKPNQFAQKDEQVVLATGDKEIIEAFPDDLMYNLIRDIDAEVEPEVLARYLAWWALEIRSEPPEMPNPRRTRDNLKKLAAAAEQLACQLAELSPQTEATLRKALPISTASNRLDRRSKSRPGAQTISPSNLIQVCRARQQLNTLISKLPSEDMAFYKTENDYQCIKIGIIKLASAASRAAKYINVTSGPPKRDDLRKIVGDLADIFEKVTPHRAGRRWNPHSERNESIFNKFCQRCCMTMKIKTGNLSGIIQDVCSERMKESS